MMTRSWFSGTRSRHVGQRCGVSVAVAPRFPANAFLLSLPSPAIMGPPRRVLGAQNKTRSLGPRPGHYSARAPGGALTTEMIPNFARRVHFCRRAAAPMFPAGARLRLYCYPTDGTAGKQGLIPRGAAHRTERSARRGRPGGAGGDDDLDSRPDEAVPRRGGPRHRAEEPGP